MSAFRSLSAALLSAASAFSVVTASGCGTEAVGIDDCRDIEQARCEAGQHCGLVDDVDACKRFYRDHCLHGLASRATAGASVAACVEVIRAAGRCADEDAQLPLGECGEVVTDARPGLLRVACDVVRYPERATECSFLVPEPIEEGTGGQSSGSGGASSEDTATGGSGGSLE